MRNGDTVVELVAPTKNAKNYRSLRKKIGDAPYHLCYVADDFNVDVDYLQKIGWQMIQEPKIAVAINNKQVAFFFHPEIGMIELLEP